MDKRLEGLALSDTFVSRADYPIVGTVIGSLTIIGAWVNSRQTIIGYKLQCSCSEIINFTRVDAFLNRGMKKCTFCSKYRNPIHKYFNDTYGYKDGEKLRKLYWKRTTILPIEGPSFDEHWKTNYKAFAEHIVNLLNFDKWPIYQLDRIDFTKGYIHGNLRFISQTNNNNNRSITRFVEFKDGLYPRAEFIRIITGGLNDDKLYYFIADRIHGNNPKPIDHVLKELYESERKDLWPSDEVKVYFQNWYKENV